MADPTGELEDDNPIEEDFPEAGECSICHELCLPEESICDDCYLQMRIEEDIPEEHDN